MAPRGNPMSPLPAEMFLPERRNSAGIDLGDPLVRRPLQTRLEALEKTSFDARPSTRAGDVGQANPVFSPQDTRFQVGTVIEADAADIDEAIAAAAAAYPGWDRQRSEEHTSELQSLMH